ncbi:MAG TPA: ABC transporter substrate-binding protein [Acetobacteraceae bacterium]|nr:ABC transporter substrate-binding protein [Acetobacteraceae bacterium]
MRRRAFVAGTAAALAAPSLARGDQASVLKYAPGGDLPSVDPLLIPSYETRSHAFMVFDTLYGQAGAESGFAARPQMVAAHQIEDDGRTWKLTLREGLLFHDGTRVLARDCVASIRRWSVRDQSGQTLMQRVDALVAPDDRTILFRLRTPFPMLPDALGKFGTQMCAMMPERLASTDPFKPITEVIGSGPFRFKADEQVSGSLHVYERFADYQPREDGKADFIAGPKVAHFDRVEWHIIPDPTTAIGALKNGEIDWVEYPLEDVLPALRRDRRVKLEVLGAAGWWGVMRPNHTLPPFNNPAIRRALLHALDQRDFMTAAIGTDPAQWHVPMGYFSPASPMASDAGLAVLSGGRDLGKARSELRAAGYRGEKIVVILPATLWRARVFGEVAAELLRRIGMNVEEQVMDTASWARRLVSRNTPDQGGWNVFCTSMQGTDALSPASHAALRGNGAAALAGWPDSPTLETLRERWLEAPDSAAQRAIADDIQAQAFIDVPYYPLGAFYPSTAYRSDLTGVLDGQAIFWNVRRDV